MALPKLNDIPKYELTIPSTNQTVKFRPYLVKEEKVLMLAFESQDQNAALNAVVDTLRACIQEDLDIDKLKLFDIEYIFTKIRAKSVGESVDIIVTCVECEHQNEVNMAIDDVNVTIPEISNKINITKDICVELQWPTYIKTIENSLLMTTESETIQTIELMADCLVSLETEEEKILFKDETREEIINFLGSMTSTQFDLIKSYIEKMPVLEKRHTHTCENCKHTSEILIRNLTDFF